MVKRRILRAALVLCTFVFFIIATACNFSGEEPKQKYKVSFIAFGDSVITEFYTATVTEAPDMTQEDFIFQGWYLSSDFRGESVTFPFTPTADTCFYAKLEPAQDIMPVLNINLDNGVNIANVNRETYVTANTSLGSVPDRYKLSDIRTEIRGRGNGSWQQEKKSYRIKFEKKQSLFGLPASRHWVLHANGVDKTLARNNTTFAVSRSALTNIEYTSSSHPVELYVNGGYHGVYSVYEHIRVDGARVNIPSAYKTLDTGYLLEYDAYAEGESGVNYFGTSGLKYSTTMHSPDPDEYAANGVTKAEYKAQVNYIRDYVQSVTNAVLSKNYSTFTSLADEKSFVDMYILHEYFKNTDTGYSSFYMYKKPGGKLFLGPAWDFDFSSGDTRGDSSTSGLYVADTVKQHSNFTSSEIFISLMATPEFVSAVKTRWASVSSKVKTAVNDELDKALRFESEYAENASRWSISDWKGKLNNLRTWLIKREEWLSGHWKA